MRGTGDVPMDHLSTHGRKLDVSRMRGNEPPPWRNGQRSNVEL